MAGSEAHVLTRRTCLTSIPATVLAGCVSENSTPPALGKITVLNTRSQSTEVSITITKDDEIVYDREHTLEPRRDSSVDEVSINESWMGSGTDFKLEVEVPSVETELFSTSKFEEEFDYEFDCVPLNVYIRDDTIELFHGMNGCSEV